MKKSELGQALLIIVLVMAVGLTIGLAIISRSITDIKISQQEEESARAFSAAEAGLEQALLSGEGGDFSGEGFTASVIKTAQGGGTTFDFGSGKFEKGEIQTVWLIEHTDEGDLGGSSFPANETITVCWGDDSDDKTAVEVTLLYQDGGEFKIARGAYDADTGRGNNFDEADHIGGDNCGLGLAFAEDIDLGADLSIPLGATLYALRAKILYNDNAEPLAVSSSSDFPSQGDCFESVATITEPDITRRLQQCQFYKAPPGIFDYVLFSKTNLTK
jgi:hypothetical protein